MAQRPFDIDALAAAILTRTDASLPDGAKDLVAGIWVNAQLRAAEPRRSHYFLGDWKPKPAIR